MTTLQERILDWIATGQPMLQLHGGHPGPDGVDNQLADTTRRPVRFGPIVDGKMVSVDVVSWPAIHGAGHITHASVWVGDSFAGVCNIPGFDHHRDGDEIWIAAGAVRAFFPEGV